MKIYLIALDRYKRSCAIVIYELIHLKRPYEVLDKIEWRKEIQYDQGELGQRFKPILSRYKKIIKYRCGFHLKLDFNSFTFRILVLEPSKRPTLQEVLYKLNNPMEANWVKK